MEFNITPARAIAVGTVLLAAGLLFPVIRQSRAPQAAVTLPAPPRAGGTLAPGEASAPLYGEIQTAETQPAGNSGNASGTSGAEGAPAGGQYGDPGAPAGGEYSENYLPAEASALSAPGLNISGFSGTTDPVNNFKQGTSGRLSQMPAGGARGQAGGTAARESAAAAALMKNLANRIKPGAGPESGPGGSAVPGAASRPGGPAAKRQGGQARLPNQPASRPAPNKSNSPQSPAAPASPSSDGKLSGEVMKRAGQVSAEINGSGGYRFDGSNDCYGFVRRVWNPVLSGKGLQPLPVSDMVSGNWAPITSWTLLMPGDVLATHQGHMWGASWHGGLFSGIVGGKPYSFDNSPSNNGGAYPRIAPSGVFHYYYVPTHKLLSGQG